MAETRQLFHSNNSDKGPTSFSKGTKNIRIDLIQQGGNIIPTTRFASTYSSFFFCEIEFCADPRHVSVGYLDEPAIFTGYEPKHLAEDKKLAEHEDSRAKPFFFFRPNKVSTYNSSESIGTHPLESDLYDEQIRVLWASPLYLQEQEANSDRPTVDHSVRENLVSGSSQVPKRTGRPVTLFSSENRSNQETFSDREDYSSGDQQVFVKNESLFRFSDLENSMKSLF